jgi:hypothetical protein
MNPERLSRSGAVPEGTLLLSHLLTPHLCAGLMNAVAGATPHSLSLIRKLLE